MNLAEFQRKISGTGKPVVVDFWAPWCVPCRITRPILESIAREYDGKVKFMPVHADDSREVLAQFQIIGIPTVLALRNENVVGRLTGARNESEYRALFESLAENAEIKFSISSVDRLLRLGAGLSFAMVGLSSGSWIAVGLGGILAFFGVYDRCPVWRTLTGMFQRKSVLAVSNRGEGRNASGRTQKV